MNLLNHIAYVTAPPLIISRDRSLAGCSYASLSHTLVLAFSVLFLLSLWSIRYVSRPRPTETQGWAGRAIRDGRKSSDRRCTLVRIPALCAHTHTPRQLIKGPVGVRFGASAHAPKLAASCCFFFICLIFFINFLMTVMRVLAVTRNTFAAPAAIFKRLL